MLVERYCFKPAIGYWFTAYSVESLRGRSGCVETTLDIGLSREVVCVEGNRVIASGASIELDLVEPRSRDRVVFYSREDGRSYEVALSTSEGYYKLKALGIDVSPTLEINGIHMHRIAGIDPWRDSMSKVRRLGVRPGDTVLDTCLGLGYTAIGSLRRGARAVYAVEVDENVLWIAGHNPWSRSLSSERVSILRGDVTRLVSYFPDNYFDRVMHDPPRYSSRTGDLYSSEFYAEVFRVLRPGGKLYHYTGEPRKHGAPSIVKGIGERLRRVGFHPVIYDRETMGYVARKPEQ